jgi:hypothetical protein
MLRVNEIEEQISKNFMAGCAKVLEKDLLKDVRAVTCSEAIYGYDVSYHLASSAPLIVGDIHLRVPIQGVEIDTSDEEALSGSLNYRVFEAVHEVRNILLNQKAQFFVSGLSVSARRNFADLLLKIRDAMIFLVSDPAELFSQQRRVYCDERLLGILVEHQLVETDKDLIGDGRLYAEITDWGMAVLDAMSDQEG